MFLAVKTRERGKEEAVNRMKSGPCRGVQGHELRGAPRLDRGELGGVKKATGDKRSPIILT